MANIHQWLPQYIVVLPYIHTQENTYPLPPPTASTFMCVHKYPLRNHINVDTERPDGSSMGGVGVWGERFVNTRQFHHSLGSVYFSQSYCVCMACFRLMLDMNALLHYINYTQSVMLDRSLNDHTKPMKIRQPQRQPGEKTLIHRVAKLLNGTNSVEKEA